MKLKLKLKNRNRSKSRKDRLYKLYYIKAITYWKKATLKREGRKIIAEFSAFKTFVETQTPWKHGFFCMCEDCISYFGVPD